MGYVSFREGIRIQNPHSPISTNECQQGLNVAVADLKNPRLPPQKVVSLVRESDPQNGGTIQVKDLFHKLSIT